MIPYQAKKMSDKIDEIFRGNENFVRRKILSDENFVQK